MHPETIIQSLTNYSANNISHVVIIVIYDHKPKFNKLRISPLVSLKFKHLNHTFKISTYQK